MVDNLVLPDWKILSLQTLSACYLPFCQTCSRLCQDPQVELCETPFAEDQDSCSEWPRGGPSSTYGQELGRFR